MNYNCCFCKQIVLGLKGQDEYLDSFYLQDGECDTEVARGGVFGWCHVQCLVRSQWSQFWRNRRLENFEQIRKYDVLLDDGERYRVLLNPTGGDLVIADCDGTFTQIESSCLRRTKCSDEICLIPMSHRLDVDLGVLSNKEIAKEFSKARELSLIQLLRSLGIQSLLVEPRGIEGGAFVGHGANVLLDGEYMSGIAHYSVVVAKSLGAHISSAIRRNEDSSDRSSANVL
jgi:hypothetical protein